MSRAGLYSPPVAATPVSFGSRGHGRADGGAPTTEYRALWRPFEVNRDWGSGWLPSVAAGGFVAGPAAGGWVACDADPAALAGRVAEGICLHGASQEPVPRLISDCGVHVLEIHPVLARLPRSLAQVGRQRGDLGGMLGKQA